ncbi:hypothetical protein ACTOB_005999 [Actinoplanes oblitus]|uniref:Uncharacterized protein n=1 Tax=Actinoplanes oblitus TaxID=3040509 RepID=A0ABY8W810_9ACTN|nr:hypothetical protein [Actinoplanes oblitus]WIM93999.1 hypothetical protein ACTOB_005999 [Actinoplanes oblitus]
MKAGRLVSDLGAAEQWLDSWVSQVNVQAERSVDLARRVATSTGSATGCDEAVRVTVGSDSETGRAVIGSFGSRFPSSGRREDR